MICMHHALEQYHNHSMDKFMKDTLWLLLQQFLIDSYLFFINMLT
jgi:hypothetical protein